MSTFLRSAAGAMFVAGLAFATSGAAQQPNIRAPAEVSGGGAGNIRSGEGAPARGAGTSGIRLPRNTDRSIYEPAEVSGGGAGNIRSGEGAPARGAGTSGIRLPRNTDRSIYEPAEVSGGGAGNIRSGEGAPPRGVSSGSSRKKNTVRRKSDTETTGTVRR